MEYRITPGQKYRIEYPNIKFGLTNPNNKKIHILAIVDKNQVVFKWFCKAIQRWIYNIETIYFFESHFKDNYLIKVK